MPAAGVQVGIGVVVGWGVFMPDAGVQVGKGVGKTSSCLGLALQAARVKARTVMSSKVVKKFLVGMHYSFGD